MSEKRFDFVFGIDGYYIIDKEKIEKYDEGFIDKMEYREYIIENSLDGYEVVDLLHKLDYECTFLLEQKEHLRENCKQLKLANAKWLDKYLQEKQIRYANSDHKELTQKYLQLKEENEQLKKENQELKKEADYFERKKCKYWTMYNEAHLDRINASEENERLRLELETHKHPLWSTREAERKVNKLTDSLADEIKKNGLLNEEINQLRIENMRLKKKGGDGV